MGDQALIKNAFLTGFIRLVIIVIYLSFTESGGWKPLRIPDERVQILGQMLQGMIGKHPA